MSSDAPGKGPGEPEPSSAPLPDYEQLGLFYLGRRTGSTDSTGYGEPLLYDSRDLTTHAVCVGMTGSGKTGLGIALLEEAALDGVPALIIDPKGDLGNLLLTFPDLAPEDFVPWVDGGEARSEGLSREAFAARQAELWRSGLASWDQDAARITRLRSSADFRIYTPGSEAGLPISILSSFAAPGAEVVGDGDLLRDRVTTVTTGLLSLLGRDADPVTSREHILVARILDEAWRAGRGFDLAGLIQAIQRPGFERVGVLDLESFYPAGDRFELAMALNNLLASPTFAPWLQGEALDLDRLLYAADGRPRLAVVSIAHLSEAERMFFVTLLLAETLGWIRRQPGTGSLRALLYMDEIFGYMPPVAEPPSKRALLTLLKQARAYGLGLVLATQNPADLDYKGLSNAGTWLLGRLQTERDRERVIEGLLGTGGELDRGELEATLASLPKRTFLMQNAHDRGGPVLFETRWVMSYMAGPLTRDAIGRLMAPVRSEQEAAGAKASKSSESSEPVARSGARSGAVPPPPPKAEARDPETRRPLLAEAVPEAFLRPPAGGGEVRYRPALLGIGSVHYEDRKRGIAADEPIAWLTPFLDGVDPVDWRRAESLEVTVDDLDPEPVGEASFEAVPEEAAKKTSYTRWERELADVLYRDRRLTLWKSPTLDEVSRPGEDERAFRARLAPLYREERDRRLAEVEERHGKELARIEERIDRAEGRHEQESSQVKDRTWDAVVSAATTLGSALFGRGLSRSTVRSVGTAAKGFGRIQKERREAASALEDLEELRRERDALVTRRYEETLAVREQLEGPTEPLETVELAPRRKDVEVEWVGLAWVPV